MIIIIFFFHFNEPNDFVGELIFFPNGSIIGLKNCDNGAVRKKLILITGQNW